MRCTCRAVSLVLAVGLAVGCDLIRGANLTGPGTGGGDAGQGFAGTWASTTAQSVPLGAACSDFQWQITDASAQGASGTFAATCAGGTRVSGAGTGSMSGTTLNWTMAGTATPPQGAGCPFNLSGAAVPETTDTMRVHYSGTVCGVAVSGSELLNRRS
jgi:hypothetical protein